jgi:hypothetical protein
MNIEIFGLGDQFTTEEAVNLLNSHVVKKGEEELAKNTNDVIGFVGGVITLNDEIEVIVKFFTEMVQLNKTDFYEQMTLLEMSS